MSRVWIWLQLVIGWMPVWALYTTLIVSAHPPTTPLQGALLGLRAIVPAALLGLVVHRFTRWLGWPRPFRVSFVLYHLCAAAAYAGVWIFVASSTEFLLHGSAANVSGRMIVPFFVLGVTVSGLGSLRRGA